MSDDLVYRIFVELAVLRRMRDVDGTWNTDDPAELQRLLSEAFAMVERACAPPGS